MRFYGRLGFEATGAAEPLPEDPARTIVTLRRPAG
jgi:hypothetical protein